MSPIASTVPDGLDDYGRTEFWVHQIQELDRVLERPSISLIKLVHDAVTDGPELEGETRRAFTVRTRIDDSPQTADHRFAESLLIHAVACSAVQRLHSERRRFSWLKEVRKKLDALRNLMPKAFTGHPALQESDPLKVVKALEDVAFGTLSPITAAEVFWLLIRAGESHAHGDLGFLALFALLWGLKRRTHGPAELGAALGRWRPTVAVTARCVLPILKLNETLEKRAELYDRIRDACETLHKNEEGRDQSERWKFAAAVDRLSTALNELARISLKPGDFYAAANNISRIVDHVGPETETKPLAERVRREMRDVLVKLGVQNGSILEKAKRATNEIQPAIIAMLKDKSRKGLLAEQWKLHLNWDAQVAGAQEAHDTCVRALRRLQKAVHFGRVIARDEELPHMKLVKLLRKLRRINEEVRDILRDAVTDSIEWCRRAVPREIAYASAGADTEFDAAELLAGVEIAQWARTISRGEAADAIRRSLRVASQDGSWSTGQPIFLEKRVLGVWPSTPDVVLLLASAVKPYDRLHDADAHLLRFVSWLEARVKTVTWKGEQVWGWQSEAREPGIDIWSTATAIKTLLEIREIFEERLWEICENRFTVLRNLIPLHTLDPVDLGAAHRRRLHRRLYKMASETQHDFKDAEYSFVLHGPPGSSKSAVAQAIGNETWRGRRDPRGRERPPRFVRITPADFTRRGLEGLDVEARFIFQLLSHVRGVTIFFDEIDDLLRNRKIGSEPSFIRLVIPGMLNRLQDLRDAAPSQEICFLLATNYIDQIEPALTRPGRIDAVIPVPYPDPWSRESILERIAKDESVEVPGDVKAKIIDAAGNQKWPWPWPTYAKLCKKLVDSGAPTLQEADDLLTELGTHLQSPEYYYRNARRWRDESPLKNEVVHFGFGIEKSQTRACEQLAVLLGDTQQKADILEFFVKEWVREGRPDIRS